MPFDRVWNATYESQPGDNENINLGAQRIRNLKVDIRERVALDHSFAGDANDGLHLHVEFLPQSVSPTPVNATDGELYTQTISGNDELLWKSSGNIVQLTFGAIFAPITTPSLHVTADATVDGNTTLTGFLFAKGGIFNISGDANFTLRKDPNNTNNILNYEDGAYIQFSNSLSRFEFFINHVLVFTIP